MNKEVLTILFLYCCAVIFGGCFILGLTSPPTQVYRDYYSTIEMRAMELRYSPVEQLYLYQEGQEVFHSTGTVDWTIAPDKDISYGGTLLHNHPNWTAPGYTLEEGFSYQDLKVASDTGIQRMILVTVIGIWTTDRPFKVWNIDFFN
jgi:hypothetical protein